MSSQDPDRTPPIGVDDAYAVETPEQNKALYENWATTYESGFIEYMGYVYHRTVANLFVAHRTDGDGDVLDVGCGTGIVGAELRRLMVEPVDGLDLSPAMLEQAADKTGPGGDPAFRRLIPADLTETLPIDDATYSGIVSAGTFTHGHVGPDAFDELVRIAAPNAVFAIGINAEHYEQLGFQAKLDDLVEAGAITAPDLIDIAIYETDDGDHANDRALVAIFHRAARASTT